MKIVYESTSEKIGVTTDEDRFVIHWESKLKLENVPTKTHITLNREQLLGVFYEAKKWL